MSHIKRKAIPDDVRRAVLIEAGYRCAVPTCRALLIVDLHHLVPVRDGGSNDAGNLLALCPTCHALHERGKIDAEAVRSWKAVLVSLSAAVDRAALDHLLLLRDVSASDRAALALTGDGLGAYAGLIFAGLAQYKACGGLRGGLHADWFEVRIAEKGLALLQAWEAGDPERIRSLSESAIHDQAAPSGSSEVAEALSP